MSKKRGTHPWKAQFEELVLTLEAMDFEVETGPGIDNEVLLGNENVVYINSSLHPEKRYYYLLHELGHILISRDWDVWSRMYPGYRGAPHDCPDGRVRRSKTFQVGLLAEELDAWSCGLSFVKSLGHVVNHDKFMKLRDRCVASYIVGAAEVWGILKT